MTVGLNQLNTMFRDFKVAEDVAKMMEMRRFEVEYTMYGCLFFEQQQRRYLISSQEAKIIDFIQARSHFEQYPLPVVTHTLMTTVPAGNEEEIVRLVKLKLANTIRASYDPLFLQEFQALAETAPDDAAAEILTELQAQMAGLYRMDNLILFEGLLDLAKQAKHLTAEHCQRYEAWLQEERRALEDDASAGDQLWKELYGIGYLQGNQIHVYYNAEKSKVYHKKETLEKEQILVSTIFSKLYWYNYDKTLRDVRREFEAYLYQLFDATYFSYMKQLKALPVQIDSQQFHTFAQQHQNKGQEMHRAIEMYRCIWNVI